MLQYITVHLQPAWQGATATTKTATLSLRIDPGVKEALHAAAQQEYRTRANMVEVLIRVYCQQHNIALEEASQQVGSNK